MSAADEWAVLDRRMPLEPEEHTAQLAAVRATLGDAPRRVLDLGCGSGRLLGPLVADGHDVVGLDRDPVARTEAEATLAALGPAAGASAGASVGTGRGTVVGGDLFDPDTWPAGPFDAVLCVGQTFMLAADVDEAVALLSGVASRLGPSGWLGLDDIPGTFWPLVAEGAWPAGISEDGTLQLVWDDRDAVFAVRRGDDVDPEAWEVRAEDVRCRLWTDGALALCLRAAGLSGARREAREGLLVVRTGAAAESSADPAPLK